MLFPRLPCIFVLTSLFSRVFAAVALDPFPTEVYVNQSYTLSWTATANYTYTIWLVSADEYESGEFDWTKEQGLATGLVFPVSDPNFTWRVEANTSTDGYFALWIDAFPIPFNGLSIFNITQWFVISDSTPSSTTTPITNGTPAATHTPDASSGDHEQQHHSGLAGGAIAGIVIGLLVAVAIIVGALLLARRRKKVVAVREREAQARANRLAPVMQSPAAIEMHGRNGELGKDIAV